LKTIHKKNSSRRPYKCKRQKEEEANNNDLCYNRAKIVGAAGGGECSGMDRTKMCNDGMKGMMRMMTIIGAGKWGEWEWWMRIG
jgi:hypothetical protein